MVKAGCGGPFPERMESVQDGEKPANGMDPRAEQAAGLCTVCESTPLSCHVGRAVTVSTRLEHERFHDLCVERILCEDRHVPM